MDKREIEGSRERAADRGRQEDLGWPEGGKPSLGDPTVVNGLVRDFATEVIGIRTDYNRGKLSGDEAKRRIRAAARQWGDIFMGRSGDFAALPWNKQSLGAQIRRVLAVADDADPGETLFLELARSITDVAVEHEAGRLSDPAAKQHLRDALGSVAELLMGYPR
jgi:hypothetical protein